MMHTKPITMTILGGFLGSGKTTVLNTIIRNLPEDQKTVLLINDFGDINIDALLVKKGNYSKKEIRGGCICCSLKEQLLQNLLTIVNEEKPDHIFIEATGLAVPWEMKKSIELNFKNSILQVDEVLVCTDSVQFDRYHDYLPVYSRQFEGRPYILMTKSDLYSLEKIEEIKEKLHKHYPGISGFSKAVNGKWMRSEEPENGTQKIQNTAMSFLLDSEMIDTGLNGIEQLTIQGELKGTIKHLKSIIMDNKENIIRLKALISCGGSWYSIQFDGENLSEDKLDTDLSLSGPFPDSSPLKQSVMTLFCMKEHKEELSRKLSEKLHQNAGHGQIESSE